MLKAYSFEIQTTKYALASEQGRRAIIRIGTRRKIIIFNEI